MSEHTPTGLSELLRSLKREPAGLDISSLGSDGVFRVFYSIYHPNAREVLDAVRLSPAQIKEWLDGRPFKQSTEDRFRGVDGRNVSDEDMFNPPESFRPWVPPDDVLKEHQRQVAERRRKAEEDERNGVKFESKGRCGGRKSDYNLDPI